MSASIPPQGKGGAMRGPVLLLGLFFALSPVVLDLAQHLVVTPSARACSVFWVLFAVQVAATSRQQNGPARRDGYILIGLCAAISVLAIGGGFARGARVALPIGVLGLARSFGILPLRTAALAFWLLPLPSLVNAIGFPLLERGYLASTVPILEWAGHEVTRRGLAVEIAGQSLVLTDQASGFGLFALLTGLVWYAGIVHRTAWRRTAVSMFAFGALFLPLQWIATLLALSALATGDAIAAPRILETAIWPIVAGLGVLRIHSGSSRGTAPSISAGSDDIR